MIDNLDKSFLRLKTSFAEAKFELLQDSDFVYRENIVLNPTKTYTQITNSSTSIAFDDSYICELVDCKDNAVLDITDKIFIEEFQDNNGIYQLKFEITPIGQDFYFEPLHLRFTQVLGDLKVWSNSFLVTDQCKTFRLEYKSYNYYQGISYDIANIYQSIDLVGYIDLVNNKETVKVYTQLNGDIRQSRPIQAPEYTFNIDFIDSFTFTRLASALNSDLVYINGTRFIKSENVQAEERQGKANYFPTSFKGQFNETDILNLGFQIAPQLSGVYFPINRVLFPVLNPFPASATFNYNLSSVTDVEVYKDGGLFLSVPNPTITDNQFNFQIANLELGEYYVLFKATDIRGQTLTADNNTWTFRIANGEYNRNQYNRNQYFTN